MLPCKLEMARDNLYNELEDVICSYKEYGVNLDELVLLFNNFSLRLQSFKVTKEV
jgi:hypothetical protein